MTIKELQAFLHLAQTLHFNQTASAIHTSPSTLSRTIQRLETEFDQVLFERDNRSVCLTDAGKRFVEFAESVIEQWQRLKLDFSNEGNALSGEISIYCTVTAAYLYLPGLIEKFRQLYPKVEINLETGDVAFAYQKVAGREVDFAFAVADNGMANKYVYQQFHHIPFKVIAPRQTSNFSGYLNAEAIDWQKLPFVLPDSGPAAQRLNDWLKQMKIKPNIYAQVSGHEAIVSMIALGCGVSAVPEPVLAMSPVKDKIQVLGVPLTPKPFDLGMICLRKRLESPVMNAFWELVVNQSD